MEQQMDLERKYLTISGLVQGVGFRPFLFKLAAQYDLTGWVRNNFAGVETEIQGTTAALNRFLEQIQMSMPPGAVIDELECLSIPTVTNETGFCILNSEDGSVLGSPLPDQGICPECTAEFHDPHNRRWQYPLNSCVSCGPRFTIIQELPYDRNRTAMQSFPLCPECQKEYTNPSDRRFHGQTITCPNCGPALRFIDPQGLPCSGEPFAAARAIIKRGGIIGIKGIGGYHLACNAGNQEAVKRLRELKGRDNRPFAVMFRDLVTVKGHCLLSPEEEELLQSAARPILLLPQLPQSSLAGAVNPDLKEIGAFLPYTGIQLLLFEDGIEALVMTSGNRSGAPLTIEDMAAIKDLGPMVAGFLVHNRPIFWRCDDSVLRWQHGKPIGIRRSRGYAPAPIRTGRPLLPLLACGAQQKNTFALTKGNFVYLSQHQGDLDDLAAYLAYQETISRWQRLIHCQPEWVIHDLHPDYDSTRYSHGLGIPALGVQHHLAHVASVIASQKLSGPIIGVAWDGTGFGSDGKLWGGEFLVGFGTEWRRFGHLKYTPLPGGEAAIHEPWRMATAFADECSPGSLDEWLSLKGLLPKWQVLKKAVAMGINAPETSAMGRLFDGVAALLGGKTIVSYEGEAAIWLEQQADFSEKTAYDFPFEKSGSVYLANPARLIAAIVKDLTRCTPGAISMKFHRAAANLVLEMVSLIQKETGIRQVALCGGVFQNRLLLDLTWELLERNQFQVFVPEIVPINDGGIALGQAWLGSLMIERGITDVFSGSRDSCKN